jgi:DNA ligase-1
LRKVTKEWPVLQAKARTGKTKYWQIRVVEEFPHVLVEVEFWQEGSIHQRQARKVLGKNLGRANETTPMQQALKEAQADFVKQQDKGYSEDGTTTSEFLLPMLAKDHKDTAKRLVFPCWGQPKLDGARCLFHPKRGFWSRLGKVFPVNLDHLFWDVGDVILDGELILPKPYTFQETMSAVKKQGDLTPLLEYHVFDIIMPGGFEARWRDFWTAQPANPPAQLIPVNTICMHGQDDVQRFFALFMEEGYEGLILRNKEGLYEIGQRSHHLQKYKEFIDEEFQIIDVVDGIGKEEGAAVYICKNANGQEFRTRPIGSYEDRKQQFQNKEQLIGQWVTVRYQNLTDEGKPRFPVGRGLREMVNGQPAI